MNKQFCLGVLSMDVLIVVVVAPVQIVVAQESKDVFRLEAITITAKPLAGSELETTRPVSVLQSHEMREGDRAYNRRNIVGGVGLERQRLRARFKSTRHPRAERVESAAA